MAGQVIAGLVLAAAIVLVIAVGPQLFWSTMTCRATPDQELA